MSEIDGPKYSVKQVNFSGVQRQNPVIEQEESPKEPVPQLTDFSNAKAETFGRSMLFKGNDGVNNDLKALVENPQIAKNSDEIFEAAYAAAQNAGIENPYEEAVSASTTAF